MGTYPWEGNKSLGKKIADFCLAGIRAAAIIAVGYLFIQGLFTLCCIQRVSEQLYFIRNNAFTQILGIGIFTLAVWAVMRERVRNWLNRYGHLIFMAALVVVTGFLVCWIGWTQYWYFGDMEKIYQYAGMLLKGDYSGWQPGGYPYMWPHQNGFVLFVASLLKYMTPDQSFMVIYGINICFYVIAVLSVYVSCRMLFLEKDICSLQGILLLIFFPCGFLCTLIYGDMIGFGWACASIALSLRYRKSGTVGWLLGSALCMIMAVIFKQNELLMFAGIVIVLLSDLVSVKEKRVKRAVFLFLYIAVILLGIRTPDRILEHMTQIPIGSGNSKLAHLAMGLQETDGMPGWYNGYNEQIFAECGYDTELTAEASLASIRESLRGFGEDPAGAWSFFHRKLASEWNNPTFECFHIQNFRNTSLELSGIVKSTINDGGKINLLLTWFLDLFQSALLFGILMYLVTDRDTDWGRMLFFILFLGGFVFFAAWEAKSRYVMPFFFLLIPYSIMGYRKMLEQKKIRTAAVLAAVVFVVALWDSPLLDQSLKIHKDTDAYYEYIHRYGHNFEWLKF